MGLVQSLKKVLNVFVRPDGVFDVDPAIQRAYLNRFPEPKDLFERSFFQYKCQMMLMGPIHYFLNPALGILYAIKWLTIRHQSPESRPQTDAVFCTENLFENILPEELTGEFATLCKFDHSAHLSLNRDDRKFLHELARRYPFRWHFRLKCLLKIAMYRYVLDTFHPKAILASSEYSFTSSIITEYLHRNGVEHINVMHGEKMFYIQDSFFSFDRYYVWNRCYFDLFSQLRADVGCLRVALPPVLRLPKAETEPIYDYTFYLQNEHPDDIARIVGCLRQLSEAGNRISIRPHPRFTKISEEQLNGADIRIEKNAELPIEDSLRQTRCAVSLYSTVLLQAYSNGIAIVMDDVSRPDLYRKLSELSYIGLSLPHRLLSDVLRDAEKERKTQ